jgi:hypothetical protein
VDHERGLAGHGTIREPAGALGLFQIRAPRAAREGARRHEPRRGDAAQGAHPVSGQGRQGRRALRERCALGDACAEWLVFFFPVVAIWFGWGWLFPEKMFAVWVVDYLFAFAFGIAFQYFTIAPMRDLSLG